MSTLTDRQQAAWPEAIARLQAAGARVPADIEHWSVAYAEEIRPGRGHSISAIHCDGEQFAQITMDVYGYPTTSYAELDWVHSDSDEECDCPPCAAELAEGAEADR